MSRPFLPVGTHTAMVDEAEQGKQDRRAQFEALVAKCETPLLRYVSRILNSSDVAQDVVQDT